MLPQVIGEFRVGVDPELRFSPSGVAVCKIRAVASSRKKNDQGEWVDDKATWVTLTGFKRIAENMAESFGKGDLVNVTGKLEVDNWEDSDGNKRTSVSVLIDTIGMSAFFNPVRAIKGERREQPRQDSQPQQPQEDPWSTGNSDEPPF